MAAVADCLLHDLPRNSDPRGNLTFIEGGKHIPFVIARVFYLYDVPTAAARGAHAHRALQQFLICLGGGFDVSLDDGVDRRTVHLDRPWSGLYIPPMIWASLGNFHPGSICLALASAPYNESDYYRDYELFRADAIPRRQVNRPAKKARPASGKKPRA